MKQEQRVSESELRALIMAHFAQSKQAVESISLNINSKTGEIFADVKLVGTMAKSEHRSGNEGGK